MDKVNVKVSEKIKRDYGITFSDPSLCKPQFAADCDISTIVKRFMRTGQLPAMRSPMAVTDVTNLPCDFGELQNQIARARQQFDALPLEERNKYNNSVENWLDAQLVKPVEDKPADGAPAGDKPADGAPQA